MNLAATIYLHGGGPGSGCQGENCGRKTLYHGTDVSNVQSILKSGLNKGMSPLGEDKRPIIYLSSKKKEARYFATHEGKKPYAIVVVDGKKTDVSTVGDMKSTYYSGRYVPSKAIKRIEIYDEKHNLVKTIRPK